ncbi:hypothetical protein D9M73_209410 [compost metagenome]
MLPVGDGLHLVSLWQLQPAFDSHPAQRITQTLVPGCAQRAIDQQLQRIEAAAPAGQQVHSKGLDRFEATGAGDQRMAQPVIARVLVFMVDPLAQVVR